MTYPYDLFYFLFLAPALLLAIWAHVQIRQARAEMSKVASSSGLTGAGAAAEILRVGGVEGMTVEPIAGRLTDDFDPSRKVLSLSEEVYEGRSIAAIGVAAHESGHVLRAATRSPLRFVRNLVVPAASFGSSVAWLVLLAGLFLNWVDLILLGIALFSATVVLQLAYVPIALADGRRARQALVDSGSIATEEGTMVGKVCDALAWTYVAATLTSIPTLLYQLGKAGRSARRRDA